MDVHWYSTGGVLVTLPQLRTRCRSMDAVTVAGLFSSPGGEAEIAGGKN